jgi:DNA-directed RNA polymerase specialized sigma24 family protein
MIQQPLGAHYGDQFTYTREQIETLLPGLWDKDYVHGPAKAEETEPPAPGMPRSTYKDPRKATDWIAELCDVRMAWEHSWRLDGDEREVLFLRFGLAWSQEHIGQIKNVSAATVSRRTESGIRKLIGFLDGEEQD